MRCPRSHGDISAEGSVCVPLAACQQLHVEVREQAADVTRVLLLQIRNKKGVARSAF